ncbi:MAG: hypothetical protein WBV82_21870 [Myxococcaceae bacterium]
MLRPTRQRRRRPRECREFRFSRIKVDGVEHLYAVGPDADPIEMHAPDWNLLVNGPFAGRRK